MKSVFHREHPDKLEVQVVFQKDFQNGGGPVRLGAECSKPQAMSSTSLQAKESSHVHPLRHDLQDCSRTAVDQCFVARGGTRLCGFVFFCGRVGVATGESSCKLWTSHLLWL